MRLAIVRERMGETDLDAIILVPGANMRYLFGLSWGETERLVCAIVTSDSTIFVCPKFEDSALYASLSSSAEYLFWQEHEDPYGLAADTIADQRARTVALDSNCSFGHAIRLSEAIETKEITSTEPIIAPLRARKSKAELALLKAAKQITLDVHEIIFNWIKPGIRAKRSSSKNRPTPSRRTRRQWKLFLCCPIWRSDIPPAWCSWRPRPSTW